MNHKGKENKKKHEKNFFVKLGVLIASMVKFFFIPINFV